MRARLRKRLLQAVRCRAECARVLRSGAMANLPTPRQRVFAEWVKNPAVTAAAVVRAARVDKRAARKWLQRFKAGDTSLSDAPRSGRPRKLTSADIKTARDHIRRNAYATVAGATRLINKRRSEADKVSEETVGRAIKADKAGHFKWGPVRRKGIGKANAAKRRAATTPAKVKAMKGMVRRTVCLDGTFFKWTEGAPILACRGEMGWSGTGIVRLPRPAKYHMYQCYSAIAIGPDGRVHRHKLIWVPARKGFTARAFVRHVLSPLREWADETVYQGQQHFWLLDGATPHTATSTRAYMIRENMECLEHPASSADMNPIEKAWLMLKQGIERFRPWSEDAFKKRVQAQWDSVSESCLRSFIEGLPDAMQRVHTKPDRLSYVL
jgi:transposase